jgi:DNA-binding transcriptional MerR regulator
MAAAATSVRERYPYRMKDLCELTGLSRQAIHFYVQQGLVPAGHKTGRNMAYYGEDHLERLRQIKQLQHERFLPLKAIKAILDGETEQFEPDQRQLLREVKQRMAGVVGGSDVTRTVDAVELAGKNGVSRADLERLSELGILVLVDDGDRLRVREDDGWVIEMWGQLRAAGFTAELGFEPEDMAVYADTVNALFEREKELLVQRLSHLPPDRVASMLESVLPIVNSFFARYHNAQVRDFFASMS